MWLINELSMTYVMTYEMSYQWLKWLTKLLINDLIKIDQLLINDLRNYYPVTKISYEVTYQWLISDLRDDLLNDLSMT